MVSLHVTLLYAGFLGLLLVVLSFNLMKNWIKAVNKDLTSDTDLRRAEALVGSFTDYVPLILILLGILEIDGAPPIALHLMGGTLAVARLMHAFGSNRGTGADGMRFLGAQLTYLVLTIASFACLYAYAMPLILP